MMRRRKFSSFSSSSLDVATTAAVADTALADGVEAPAKECFKEETADETAGATGSSTPLPSRRTKEMEKAALKTKLLRRLFGSDHKVLSVCPETII